MGDIKDGPYPGAAAAPEEIVALADEYRHAAVALMGAGRKGDPLSHAPGRLCAIHAIELYLNAFLLAGGASPEEVRSHIHDLAVRAERAICSGLVLRKRTAEHLQKMTKDREYLVSRYGPEMTSTFSQINRLMATLDEVAGKTRKWVGDEPRAFPWKAGKISTALAEAGGFEPPRASRP